MPIPSLLSQCKPLLQEGVDSLQGRMFLCREENMHQLIDCTADAHSIMQGPLPGEHFFEQDACLFEVTACLQKESHIEHRCRDPFEVIKIFEQDEATFIVVE